MARRSLRQIMGLKGRSKQPSPVPVPPESKGTTPLPKPEKPSPPQSLHFKCGHYGNNRDCPQCWRRKRVGAPLPKKRLPDSSTFNVSYDATTQMWSGTLQVGDVVVEGSHTSVHRLLQILGHRLPESEDGRKEGGTNEQP